MQNKSFQICFDCYFLWNKDKNKKLLLLSIKCSDRLKIVHWNGQSGPYTEPSCHNQRIKRLETKIDWNRWIFTDNYITLHVKNVNLSNTFNLYNNNENKNNLHKLKY